MSLNATNVTGTGYVSGSALYGANAKITNISGSQENLGGNLYVAGTISGSTYQGIVATITSATGSSILIDLTMPSSPYAEGVQAWALAGETLPTGSAVYVNSDGKYWRASANSGSGMPAVGVTTNTITSGQSGSIILVGQMRYDSWNWSPTGSVVYVSNTTGSLTTTAPNGSGNQVQIMGIALTSKSLMLNPVLGTVTLT